MRTLLREKNIRHAGIARERQQRRDALPRRRHAQPAARELLIDQLPDCSGRGGRRQTTCASSAA
jgi:hypothetical protein